MNKKILIIAAAILLAVCCGYFVFSSRSDTDGSKAESENKKPYAEMTEEEREEQFREENPVVEGLTVEEEKTVEIEEGYEGVVIPADED